jgi:hypothetical protein
VIHFDRDSTRACYRGPALAQKKVDMQKALASLALVAGLMAGPAFAEDAKSLLGTWRLLSYEVEAQASGEKIPVMGARPTGSVSFLPEGRVYFILTGEGRKPAATDAERAALLGTLVAYTGRYTIEGDRWATDVDVAWNPEWVGTRQVRTFKVEGDRLVVLTPWRLMPNWADKGTTRSIVTFERGN